MKTKLTILVILLIAIITLSNKSESTVIAPDAPYVEEYIEVENWMTEPFIMPEEPLEIEDWMTKPFNI